MKKTTILLIEDDAEISRLTSMYLNVEGYHVEIIDDGLLAIDAIKNKCPDLIVLDLMLPGLNGLEICQQAREFYQQPILILTACKDDVSEVSLLKTGADDYLVKPLRPHVLVARIEALLRRNKKVNEVKPSKKIIVEKENKVVTVQGKPVELTVAEHEMLKILNSNAGEIVSREQCCQALRGIDYDFSNRSIDMRISGLRKKLGDDKMPYKVIITIRNQGYKLNNE
jgi:DNA-binding response OmpR family regulator